MNTFCLNASYLRDDCRSIVAEKSAIPRVEPALLSQITKLKQNPSDRAPSAIKLFKLYSASSLAGLKTKYDKMAAVDNCVSL